MTRPLDVLIAGGGLVGASLAIALADSGLAVALVEAAAPRPDSQPSHDGRNLALARVTLNALQALGVWPLVSVTAAPIRRLHVSRAGEFGSVHLDAWRHGVEAFGAVLPAHELGRGLLQRLAACAGLQRHAPAEVIVMRPGRDAIEVDLREGDAQHTLRTRLLVGADGTTSFVRDALGIDTDVIDYAQTLIVTTLAPERPLEDCAYERFGDEGPVALLPLVGQRAGLVLSVADNAAAAMMALDDDGFLDLAQRRFGWRRGRFARLGRRTAYPIRRRTAQALVAPRAVLVGNAAQAIHPIGAQGFNLGLRDALTLAELLIAAARANRDPGAAELLATYAERRQVDREGTLAFSDGLVRLACSPAGALCPLRLLGMHLIAHSDLLQHEIARRGMGFRGAPTVYALGGRP